MLPLMLLPKRPSPEMDPSASNCRFRVSVRTLLPSRIVACQVPEANLGRSPPSSEACRSLEPWRLEELEGRSLLEPLEPESRLEARDMGRSCDIVAAWPRGGLASRVGGLGGCSLSRRSGSTSFSVGLPGSDDRRSSAYRFRRSRRSSESSDLRDGAPGSSSEAPRKALYSETLRNTRKPRQQLTGSQLTQLSPRPDFDFTAGSFGAEALEEAPLTAEEGLSWLPFLSGLGLQAAQKATARLTSQQHLHARNANSADMSRMKPLQDMQYNFSGTFLDDFLPEELASGKAWRIV